MNDLKNSDISLEAFSEEIDAVMLEYGLTESELGLAIRKSRATISNWRLIKHQPSQRPSSILRMIRKRVSDPEFQRQLVTVREQKKMARQRAA